MNIPSVWLDKSVKYLLFLLIFSACIFDISRSVTLYRLERSFVQSIAAGTEWSADPVEQVRLVTQRVHDISKNRIGQLPVNSTWRWVRPQLSPTLSMGVFGEGACGYISFLEIETLEILDFKSRTVQILGDDGTNHHIIVEAVKGIDTIFVDPLYNWVYLNEMGHPAKRAELETKWEEMTENAPLSGIRQYPIIYGVRYTNWEAFGSTGLFIQKVIKVVCGVQFVDNFSIRAIMPDYYLMRISMAFLLCCLTIYLHMKCSQ
jgi:hypothetical protein